MLCSFLQLDNIIAVPLGTDVGQAVVHLSARIDTDSYDIIIHKLHVVRILRIIGIGEINQAT